MMSNQRRMWSASSSLWVLVGHGKWWSRLLSGGGEVSCQGWCCWLLVLLVDAEEASELECVVPSHWSIVSECWSLFESTSNVAGVVSSRCVAGWGPLVLPMGLDQPVMPVLMLAYRCGLSAWLEPKNYLWPVVPVLMLAYGWWLSVWVKPDCLQLVMPVLMLACR